MAHAKNRTEITFVEWLAVIVDWTYVAVCASITGVVRRVHSIYGSPASTHTHTQQQTRIEKNNLFDACNCSFPRFYIYIYMWVRAMKSKPKRHTNNVRVSHTQI